MHYDGTIEKKELKNEFQKIINLFKWEIWRSSSADWDKESGEHRDTFKKFISDEISTIKPILRITQTGSFYVDREGQGHPNEPKNLSKFINNFELRHSINMLNHLHGNEDVDEQYDGTGWSQAMPRLDKNVSLDEPDYIYNLAMKQNNLSSLDNSQKKVIYSHWQEKVDDYKKYNKSKDDAKKSYSPQLVNHDNSLGTNFTYPPEKELMGNDSQSDPQSSFFQDDQL